MCVGKTSCTPSYSSPEVGGSNPVSQTQRAQQLFTQDVLKLGGSPLGNRVARSGSPAMPGGDLDALMAQFEQQQAGKKNGVDTSKAPKSIASAAAANTAVNGSQGTDLSGDGSGGGQGQGGGIGGQIGNMIMGFVKNLLSSIMGMFSGGGAGGGILSALGI